MGKGLFFCNTDTSVPQPCIFIIHKHVPFVGKFSNSEMHSWAPREISLFMVGANVCTPMCIPDDKIVSAFISLCTNYMGAQSNRGYTTEMCIVEVSVN